MTVNPELELALEFVEKTDRNLFITGKAGTGKTTFLHKIKNEIPKRMVVVAPTGVAVINAKGVTIHSFFQMPFGLILPNQPLNHGNNRYIKFSKIKINIIKSLDLLVIDEISMVRADLLDGIDKILRRYKNSRKVFGGIQVLMIGDLQQLAPIIKPNEWDLLKKHYDNIFFFNSKAYREADVVSIELKHIYRQKNENFISILNEIRNDTLSQESANILNERYNPNFIPKKEEGYVTLTTHNYKANKINTTELNKIKYKSCFFEATISGKFNENSYPNSKNLELKVGAQVMFIKNDSSQDKRYFNGKMGVITDISDSTVTVKCKNEDEEIKTEKETWENINYIIDSQTNEIKEDVIGSFSQIPLRLAWAITIHKSQGLTFEKLIVDAEDSFAHGQTYVAMSRCTSLEGLVLKTPITNKSIISETTVSNFTEDIEENSPNETILNESKKQFYLNLIFELFDYQPILKLNERFLKVFYINNQSIKGGILNNLQNMKDDGIIPLIKISKNFENQLLKYTENDILLENNFQIQERLKKAADYFFEQTKTKIREPLDAISFSSDNKKVNKEITTQYDELQEKIEVKLMKLSSVKNGFNVKEYLQIKSKAVFQKEKPKKQSKLRPKDESPLMLKLRNLRNELAKKDEIPHYMIFTQKSLYEICDNLPKTKKELEKVSGMGKVRVYKYGDKILKIIEDFYE